ncbi:MAG: Asp-tRNA(Asn)/Glu-tRNA(Gln) amidotransferase subunit GatA [Cardiobacteriaceae bacterium]|nr:Asp-tRNA(Asn)/Glu-tRNA(Gln) amidotransferase subunit GatA [Cardiobacteriaceae bacterium]
MSDLHLLDIYQLADKLNKKEISAVELRQEFFARIAKFNPEIGAFLRTTETDEAEKSDARRAKGEVLSLLDGIAMAHKDLFCTAGVVTTAGSKMLANFTPSHTATIAEKLANAGAVMLGKLSMDEFAMGSSNEHSAFGVVKNPWNTAKIPGGSSGGSAAAVAARLVPYATGSDTGGSIRQPASYCGVTGIKPTYGVCSRWGMIAYASSLDQAGVIATTAADCALVLEKMAGRDERDSTCAPNKSYDFTTYLNRDLEGVKIGLPKIYFEKLDPKIAKQIQAAARQYEELGAKIVDIDLENSDIAIAAYYIIASAEASSNLSRYDGVRYGYRAENPKNLDDLYRRSRNEGFGAEVKRRILLGTYALSAGYYDAYYEQARRGRRAILNSFKKAFSACDVILAPTTPTVAFDIGSKTSDPVEMYLSDLFTVAVNLAGLPGLAHPCGFVDEMPVGCQLIGSHFAESRILNLAHKYQQVTDFHRQVPAKFR